MHPIIGMNYSELKRTKVLFGEGMGLRLQTSATTSKQKLKDMISEAHRIKKERKETKFKSGIISRINARGIRLRYKLSYSSMDSNDIVGLIGEIITQDYSSKPEHEEVFVKWKRSGTSKSKGIDLVLLNIKNNNLILLEAKNSHSRLVRSNPDQVVKDRLEEALNQFENEKTLLSLSQLVAELSDAKDTLRAAKCDITKLEELCKLIKSKISADSYNIQAFMIMDKKHGNDTVFINAMSKINTSVNLGSNRDILIHLIEVEELDGITEEILKAYA